MLTVLIVEDHPVVVEGLQKLISEKGIATSCLVAYNGAQCLETIQLTQPDVILLDINLPDISGVDLCRDILQIQPSTRILAVSSYSDYSYIKRMVDNGALGYILKNAPEQEIIDAIQAVSKGKKYLAEEVKEALDGKSNRTNQPALTRRELEVLSLIAEGFTNEEVADKLFISPLTIDSHRKNLLAKFQARNTASLIKLAMQNGYLQ
jgi:DNA-binding NarL/FixJ family response regulator